jgi:hypothetical protein
LIRSSKLSSERLALSLLCPVVVLHHFSGASVAMIAHPTRGAIRYLAKSKAKDLLAYLSTQVLRLPLTFASCLSLLAFSPVIRQLSINRPPHPRQFLIDLLEKYDSFAMFRFAR